MKVLHICNDYFGGAFYRQLFREMECNDINNTVLVFLRKDQIKLHKIEQLENSFSEFIVIPLNYSLSFLGRLFPTIRNAYIWNVLKKRNISINVDLIHAHTLYSNGSLAYYFHNRTNVPYVLTIRNTDINSVLKYFFYQRGFIKKIIEKSLRLFSPAPSYSTKVSKELFWNYAEKPRYSFEAIPNPVNKFWVSSIGSPKSLTNKAYLNVLFVGEIAENKNIPFIIKTFNEWSYKGIKFSIKIIGKVKQTKKGLNYYETFLKLIKDNPNIEFVRDVNDQKILKDSYRNADIFFMVSKHETFGLVYVEAMTQGTPILYTKGEGIDGYFKDGEVGYPVKYNNLDDAREKTLLIIDNYLKISENCIKRSKEFSKEEVVKRFISNYKQCIIKINH